jgi:hypothetical protein
VAEWLIGPMVRILRDFEQLNLTHRAIHPTRITFDDLSFQSLNLGYGFLTPPGFLQPACYEPLQTCFAEPTARGAGHPSYDLYALGVTILSLFKDPRFLQPLSSADTNKRRLSEGSYAFFLRGEAADWLHYIKVAFLLNHFELLCCPFLLQISVCSHLTLHGSFSSLTLVVTTAGQSQFPCVLKAFA